MKIKLLAALMLALFTSGCSDSFSGVDKVKDNLRKPINIEETSLPAPKLAQSQYQLEVFRILSPVIQKNVLFMRYKRDLMVQKIQHQGDITEIIKEAHDGITQAEQEAFDVQSQLKEMVPPEYLTKNHQKLIDLLEDYRLLLKTAKEENNPMTLDQQLSAAGNKLQIIGTFLKVGS